MEAPPAVLRVSARADGGKLVFPYETTKDDRGEVAFEYGFPLTHGDVEALGAIGVGVAAYLGQLALAPRIELDFPANDEALDRAVPLAQMLYDVRRWKDGLPLGPAPEIVPVAGTAAPGDAPSLVSDRSLLLWSGGKDSTLGLLLLRRNGYEVRACHMAVNPGVVEAEEGAVTRLEPALGIRALRVRVRHASFLDFSTRYARNWNSFPLSNTVPFGRDLLLALAATPVARMSGTGKISLGHDHECRNAFVEYQGKRFPRNDVESVDGALALERYIHELVLPGCELLPPVAGLTGFRILYEMLVNHPGLMAEASFCFWGGNCGRCAKCLRYYLAQRVFRGTEVLSFQVNPLAAGACPELDDLFANRGATGMLFEREVFYCLGRLVERGDTRPGEDRLAEFEEGHYAAVAPKLDSLEATLMAAGADPQLPSHWATEDALAAPR